MLVNKYKKILVLVLVFIFSTPSFAADEETAFSEETKQDLLIVVGGGLAGAVLGLSTLSFVEKPKEHTRNILVGSAIGIIAGVAFVAFNQANKSKEYFAPTDTSKASPDFNSLERELWHLDNLQKDQATYLSSPKLSYQFSF